MPKYTVIQSYTAQDIYKNVEAVDVQDAINKIGGLPVDENNHEDTHTEVKLEEEQQEQRLPYYYGERKK